MSKIAEEILHLNRPFSVQTADGRRVITGELAVTAPIVFAPYFRLDMKADGGSLLASDSRETCHVGWLPRGNYRVTFHLPDSLRAAEAEYRIELLHTQAMSEPVAAAQDGRFAISPGESGVPSPSWTIEALAPTPPLASLSCRKGHSDWFFRHFDHAASVVMDYILGNSPLLRGRILDVGCGDGITDLSVALRTGCQELIGIDPFKGFQRLPEIVKANSLPSDVIPKSLRFLAEDANDLPFPDDSFDVVISWGSVEHMAGGYLQALREVKRVLKPDGLFFVAPGLFYSTIGHHLDEFSDEPFVHLKKSREELRKMVLETPPRYIDRSGEFASNEQYWQWFTELNPITVTEFEKQLRALELEPWRVALRTIPVFEYTPELQRYPIETLANTELYMSCVSRKRKRGKVGK